MTWTAQNVQNVFWTPNNRFDPLPIFYSTEIAVKVVVADCPWSSTTSRCIGDVARVLKQQVESTAAIAQRNAALQALDDDGFSLSLFR